VFSERPVRKVFLVLDARWEVRWKDLNDYAREHDTLEGYLEVLDDFPYQRVAFDDGVVRDYNFAAQAQFRPSYDDSGYYNGMYDPCVESGLPPEYCRGCLGLVSDLIALLERDGVADQKISAAYAATEPPTEIPLRRLPFRKFDDFSPFPQTFPCAFARPQTYRFKGVGHYGDNGFAYEFARARDTYDGTEGLRAELGEFYRREFFATVAHFTRLLEPSELPDFPDDARLVVYMQSDGAITRLAVNGRWFPLWEHFPSYGDPYVCRCFRGHRYEIPVADLGLRRGAENKLTIEHIATGRGHGANVVFALQWREKIERPERRKKMGHPRKGYALGDIIDRWNIMLTNLADEIQGFVDAQPYYNALQQIIEEVQKLNAEQEELKGLLKAKTEELYAKIKEGEKNYSSLVRYLKMKFGPRSPILAKYIPQAEAEVDKTKGDFKTKPQESENEPK